MEDLYSEKKGWTSLLAKERDRQGLCTFCTAASRCALIDTSSMPILQCEEFRIILRSEEGIVQESVVFDTDPGEAPTSEHVDHTDWGQKGLCGNCAISDACPFTIDEGGVWHCEEYR